MGQSLCPRRARRCGNPAWTRRIATSAGRSYSAASISSISFLRSALMRSLKLTPRAFARAEKGQHLGVEMHGRCQHRIPTTKRIFLLTTFDNDGSRQPTRSRGPFSRGVPEGGARLASRGCGSHPQAREVRKPTAGHNDPAARSSLHDHRRQCRGRKRGPAAKKSPMVERREARAPIERCASRLASATGKVCACRRSAAPRMGGQGNDRHPGAPRRGNGKRCPPGSGLFDIVKSSSLDVLACASGSRLRAQDRARREHPAYRPAPRMT